MQRKKVDIPSYKIEAVTLNQSLLRCLLLHILCTKIYALNLDFLDGVRKLTTYGASIHCLYKVSILCIHSSHTSFFADLIVI